MASMIVYPRKVFLASEDITFSAEVDLSLTDKLTASELVEKAFVYITSLTRECRKALTAKFEREYKGLPLDSVEAVMRKEVESWFTMRDRNIKLSYTNTVIGKSDEILVVYSGATKDAHFKISVNGLFTLVGSSSKASSYLKNLNVNTDKRDFTR
ncbi:MAG: hypothetical protein V1850_02085 [Candidatus Bathyarchaeota archaeon]